MFVIAFVFAAFNAGDAMASPSGGIAGSVTDAVTNAPIYHIVACVREAGSNGKEECGESNESGEYEITDVPPGQYKVLFYPVGLAQYDIAQYLSQYYPGVPTSSEDAQPVSVVAGAVTSPINARMQEGGWVTGRVTAAGSGTPLEDVPVCARNENGPWLVSSCTDTNSHGEYGYFYALEPGPYKIEFGPSAMGYEQQFYNEVPLLSEAQPVIIEAGKTTAGIDAALQLPSVASPPIQEIPPGAAPNGSQDTKHYTPPELPWANQSGKEGAEQTVAEQRAKEHEEQQVREGAVQRAAELKYAEGAQQNAPNQAEHPACRVPDLKGDTLSAARRALAKAHCRLGRVSRRAHRGSALRVISQSTRYGKRLAARATIAVVLGLRRASHPR